MHQGEHEPVISKAHASDGVHLPSRLVPRSKFEVSHDSLFFLAVHQHRLGRYRHSRAAIWAEQTQHDINRWHCRPHGVGYFIEWWSLANRTQATSANAVARMTASIRGFETQDTFPHKFPQVCELLSIAQFANVVRCDPSHVK